MRSPEDEPLDEDEGGCDVCDDRQDGGKDVIDTVADATGSLAEVAELLFNRLLKDDKDHDDCGCWLCLAHQRVEQAIAHLTSHLTTGCEHQHDEWNPDGPSPAPGPDVDAEWDGPAREIGKYWSP